MDEIKSNKIKICKQRSSNVAADLPRRRSPLPNAYLNVTFEFITDDGALTRFHAQKIAGVIEDLRTRLLPGQIARDEHAIKVLLNVHVLNLLPLAGRFAISDQRHHVPFAEIPQQRVNFRGRLQVEVAQAQPVLVSDLRQELVLCWHRL